MAATELPAVHFADFTLEPSRRNLRRAGRDVALGARAMDILIELARTPGSPVSKDDLLRLVWSGRVVEENNLTVQIAALRRALGADADGQGVIRTLPGRGYLLTLPSQPHPPKPTGLPVRDGFIGRKADLETVINLLDRAPLVTLTGTGGIGKTRLAHEIMAILAPRFSGGVVFADISPADTDIAVVEAVATAGGIGLGSLEPTAGLVAAWRARPVLLVLDNCERRIDAVAELAEALLARCPGLRILATSRESLFLTRETVYRLPPMGLAPDDPALDAVTAIDYDAIGLFVARAVASAADFRLSDDNAAAVARICRRLDGIALAIEMAVPRLKVLTLAQLEARLDERLSLLVATARGVAARHRTLVAMLDWSYDLLAPRESDLLRGLSVFPTDADLDAVVAVIGASEAETLDLIAALADKSLLVVDHAPAGARYRLLETVRHYAAQKRAEETQWSARHAAHFANRFAVAEAEWATTATPTWLARHAPEMDNLRAAMEWAFASAGNSDLALRLLASTYPLWWDLPQMPIREGQRWYARVTELQIDAAPPAIAARIWLGASWRDMRNTDRENLPTAERAAALFRAADDATGLAMAIWRIGTTRLNRAEADTLLAMLEDAARPLRPHGANKILALLDIKIADIHLICGRFAVAHDLYRSAMAMADAVEHWYAQTVCTTNLSDCLFELGRGPEAIALLAAFRDRTPPERRPPSLAPLVAHLLCAGQIAEMREAAIETITTASVLGLAAAVAWTAESLALYVGEAGDLAEAARLAGHASAVLPDHDIRTGARRQVLARLRAALADLEPARRLSLEADGAAWTAATAAARALSACGGIKI